MINPNISIKEADIFIVDDLAPETVAMAQALYSRSPQSVATHLEKINKVGHEKFMASYYVGYGHKSIGDCGSTTLFIENVSMLAAKAIQDWKLYRGQEASTRYLDMSKQKILNPIGTINGQIIQDRWMNFYKKVLQKMIEYYSIKYPQSEDEDTSLYAKTIKAKAFDVARGFLPAGATTYVSWHTDLRQAHDHLANLNHHPLNEVKEIARGIYKGLTTKYPSSFSHKIYDAQEQYRQYCARNYYYDSFVHAQRTGFSVHDSLDIEALTKAWSTYTCLSARPPRTELPAKLEKYGSIVYNFPLDFGSFRDIQRHRNGVCEMPILSTKHDFFEWYLDQLPEELRIEADQLIDIQTKEINNLPIGFEKQYYVAMGFSVACEVTYSLPQAVYVAELRSSQTVHPTLRKIAQQMASYLQSKIPELTLYADMGLDEWSIRRGKQDIVQKSI